MNDALPHCRSQWEVNDGQLTVGGFSIDEAVGIAGGTPVFLYDRTTISAAVGRLRAFLPDVELFYSIKANPMAAIVDFIAGLVDGFDVASAGELVKAVSAGRQRSAVQFSGPGKQEFEIAQAVSARAVINVESTGQVKAVALAADRLGIDPEVVLRVNPHSILAAAGLRMGGAGSQFGVDADLLPELVSYCRSCKVEPAGLHFYWGTQCLDGEKVAAAQRECWQLAQAVTERCELELDYLNLGGGFGIPYFNGDRPLDLAAATAPFAEIRAELRSHSRNARLICELGRYLVGPCGLYVSRVIDLKTSGGQAIAVTDGGMHQHLAASGNLGQGLRRSFPCYTPTRMDEEPREAVRVVGSLCTPLDVLCPDAELPPLEVGDLIAIFQSGAYAATASPQGFLSHGPAREVLL